MTRIVEPIKNKTDIQRIRDLLNPMQKLIWDIGISIGIRVSDILNFNIDIVGKEKITIREKKTRKIKTFPINNTLKRKIENYYYKYRKNIKTNEKALFLSKHGKRLDRREVYRFLNRAGDKLKLQINIGTHTMRKTFGYHHYQQFKDVVILQKIFNHSDPRITLIYIGVEQDEINNSYNQFKIVEDEPIKEKNNIDFIINDKSNNIVEILKNYINNGGTRHKDFAEMLLACS